MIIGLLVEEVIDLALRQAAIVVQASASLIWGTVWGGCWDCAFVMIYHDLRVAKGSADAKQVGEIFD
jgi:hypothetical protein